jgi:hypothetical protein
MGIQVCFDYERWVRRYPEFRCVELETACEYFAEATIYHRNDGGGPVCDACQQQTLLNMATAHIAQLARQHGGELDNPLVGRVSNASQGPVSLQAEMATPTEASEWWNQTTYGAAYWRATAPYRTMHYVTTPRRYYGGIFGGRPII